MITVGNKQFQVQEGCNPNHDSHWSQVNAGTWEPATYKIFDLFLDKNSSYIDLGAWIGSTVLYGAQIAKHVYAAEPDEIALSALKENISLNSDLNNITLFEGAVLNYDGYTNIGAPGGKHKLGDSASSVLYNKIVQEQKVSAINFDSFITKFDISDCNFIKMDIEGAETIVLPVMKNFIQKYKPSLYLSFHPWHFNQNNIESMKNTLRLYKKFYLPETFEEISLKNIFQTRGIIATWT